MGVSVFDSGDVRMNAIALQAASFLHEDAQAQRLLSERGIFEDDSIWLWDLSASSHGATLRSLMCQAFEKIFEEKQEIAPSLERIKAAMDRVLER